ncbi:TPA: hypothetical protein ACH3X1_009797, partial [Trebouxia sp. C0004]
FARHKDPQLDAAGALADLLVFTLNLTGLDILQKIENQDNSWWSYRLLFKDLWHADKKQDRNALAKPLLNILQEVEGNPVVKSKVLHLFRDSGVILLASGGAGLELLQIWGHWAKGSLGQAYIEKNPLAALQAFAIASGWEQSSFMRPLAGPWYGVAYVLHRLPAVANTIVTPEYLHFTQQVMSSHDRANRQAEMDVSPAIWDSCDDLLALPAPVQMAATDAKVALPSEALDFTNGLIPGTSTV